MSIRNAIVSLFLLLAFPIAILAPAFADAMDKPAAAQATADRQDASAVLHTLQQTIGKAPPPKIRVTARGSGYVLATANGVPRHFGIESYTQELDLKSQTVSEHTAPANVGATEAESPPPESHTARADSPWSTQYVLWMTPYGFLTGATATTPMVASEMLEGSKYTIVSFTPRGGQPVRGYVNDQNVLERVRTTFQDPARGKVDVEAIYSYWMDFNGSKFPTMIIRKENGELSRILIVQKVEAGGAGTS
jgi:hypothetical protein